MRTFVRNLTLLALTFGAVPAFAIQPTIAYLDYTGVSFTLSGVCSFDVFEEAVGNNESSPSTISSATRSSRSSQASTSGA